MESLLISQTSFVNTNNYEEEIITGDKVKDT